MKDNSKRVIQLLTQENEWENKGNTIGNQIFKLKNERIRCFQQAAICRSQIKAMLGLKIVEVVKDDTTES